MVARARLAGPWTTLVRLAGWPGARRAGETWHAGVQLWGNRSGVAPAGPSTCSACRTLARFVRSLTWGSLACLGVGLNTWFVAVNHSER